MKLGQKIREARQKVQMTQSQLAGEIGCTEGYVAHLEHSRSLPSELKLLKICEIFKLDTREMIHMRQREKATVKARPFYDEPNQESLFFRDGHTLSPEQMSYAVKVIQAVEKNEKVRAAIDLIIGED